jgi:Ca2+-binding RTX toxin-like protein
MTIAPSRAGDEIVATMGTDSLNFLRTSVKRLYLDGGLGDDTITVTARLRSTMLGGDGDDRLTGGPLGDSIDAGNGNDTIIGDTSNDTLRFGDGNDVCDYSARTAPISVTFVALSDSVGTAGGDTGTDIFGDAPETLIGTHRKDSFAMGDPYRGDQLARNGITVLAGGGNDHYIARSLGGGTFFGEGGDDYMECDEASGAHATAERATIPSASSIPVKLPSTAGRE